MTSPEEFDRAGGSGSDAHLPSLPLAVKVFGFCDPLPVQLQYNVCKSDTVGYQLTGDERLLSTHRDRTRCGLWANAATAFQVSVRMLPAFAAR